MGIPFALFMSFSFTFKYFLWISAGILGAKGLKMSLATAPQNGCASFLFFFLLFWEESFDFTDISSSSLSFSFGICKTSSPSTINMRFNQSWLLISKKVDIFNVASSTPTYKVRRHYVHNDSEEKLTLTFWLEARLLLWEEFSNSWIRMYPGTAFLSWLLELLELGKAAGISFGLVSTVKWVRLIWRRFCLFWDLNLFNRN